jgi:hypothetical protein
MRLDGEQSRSWAAIVFTFTPQPGKSLFTVNRFHPAALDVVIAAINQVADVLAASSK